MNGLTQANNIIISIAEILNINLDLLTSKDYFNYLSMYYDVIYKKNIVKEMKSSIFLHLTFKYSIKDSDTITRIISFSSINFSNPNFIVKSYEDFKYLDKYYANECYESSRTIIFKNQRTNSEDFGYTKENPFCLFSIQESHSFLCKLTTENNEKLYWLRLGSICIPSYFEATNVMIDEYQLYLNGEKFKKFYICPYSYNSEALPKGLKLNNEEDHYQNLSYDAKVRGITIEELIEIHKIKPTNLSEALKKI